MGIYRIQEGSTYQVITSEEVSKAYGEAKNPPTHSEQIRFAHQIMSSPLVTIAQNESIAVARQRFEKHQYRHLPVVDSSARLVGSLAEREVLRACLEAENQNLRVADVMNPEVLIADESEEIGALASLMLEHKVQALLLLSSEGKLRGIVTGSDILRALVRSAPISSLA